MTDESYIYVADLLTGIVVFAGLGWLAKTFWIHQFWPVGVGIVVGLLVGVGMMLLRYNNDSKGIIEKDNYFRINVASVRSQRQAAKQAADRQRKRDHVSKEESPEYQASIAYRTQPSGGATEGDSDEI